MLFVPSIAEPFELPKLALLVGAALALSVYAGATLLPRLETPRPPSPLAASVLLFLVSAAISTLGSPNPRLSFYGAPESRAGLLTGAATAVVFFAARHAASGIAAWTRIAAAATLAAAVAAGYALLQALGLDPVPWLRTAPFGGKIRVFGTLGHPNFLGAYLVMALPLVAWLGLRVRGAVAAVAVGGAAALAAGATVASLSRAAWGGLAVAALVGAVLLARARDGSAEEKPGRPRLFLVSFLAGLLLVVALYAASGLGRAPLAARVSQVADLQAPSTVSRLALWRAGARMFRHHPLTGVGLDAFSLTFPGYRTAAYWSQEWLGAPAKAHSEPIHILATQGALGGLAALAVAVLVAAAVWRATRRGERGVRTAAAASGASLGAFAATGLVGFSVIATGTLAAALAGAVCGGGWRAPRASARRAAPAALAVVGAVGCWIFARTAIPPLRADAAYARATTRPLGSPSRAEALRRAERIAPWDPRYPFELGRSCLEAARHDPTSGGRIALLESAESAFRRAIALSPLEADARVGHARAVVALGALGNRAAEPEPVGAELTRAVSSDPENAVVLIAAAETWLQLGRPSEARSLALTAVRLYPWYAKPLAFVGYLALADGRLGDGVDTLRLALAREFRGDRTAEADAWGNLSGGYLGLGRFADAHEAASQALALDPSNGAARRNRTAAERHLKPASPPARDPGSAAN
jgi:O-antigen ligase